MRQKKLNEYNSALNQSIQWCKEINKFMVSSRNKLWDSRAKESEVLFSKSFNVSLSSTVFPSFSLHELLTLLSSSLCFFSSSFCFLLFLTLFSSLPHSVFFSSSLCFLLFLTLFSSLPLSFSSCVRLSLNLSLCVCLSLILSLSHTLSISLFFPLLHFLSPLFSFSLISLPYFTLFPIFPMPKHFFLYR